MKRVLWMLVMVAFLAAFAVAQNYENAGVDYTTAIQKKGGEPRIRAFEEYIKNYPDANQNVFTKLAHYWLAVDYYNTKKYGEAIRLGEKALAMGIPDKKLEGDLYLVLGNAYGVSGSPKYDLNKATSMLDKAIAAGGDAASKAAVVKKALTSPKAPVKQVTSLDRIGVMFQDKKYNDAINFYNTLGAQDKGNDKIFEIYARSLIAAGKGDVAIRDLSNAYGAAKKGITASRLAGLFQAKGKAGLDTAIDYYIEASLLFRKEGDRTRDDAALKSAKYYLYEKYGYLQKMAKYNASVKNTKPAAGAANAKEIAAAERELASLERKLNAQYEDIEMPGYEQDKITKLQNKIKQLKAAANGPAPENTTEGQALMKEQQRIESEFQGLVAKARRKLGL